MATTGDPKHKALKKKLQAEQQELSARFHTRLGGVSIEREPDDEIAQATYSVSRDMMVATMERERKTLAEIEAALKRIAQGDYGICESCEAAISEARLRALPWARLCITCASGSSLSPEHYLKLRAAS